MDATEVGEAITGGHHHHGDDHGEAHAANPANDFRRRAGVYVGVIGMLLAIASLGGEYSMKETINANIQSADTYSFYQARNIRQTNYALAIDLVTALAAMPGLPPDAQKMLGDRAKSYKAQIDHLESNPQAGDGKKELLVKAKTYEKHRDLSQARDFSFDVARALYEIGIVMGSVSIVAASPPLLLLGGVLAVVATVLSVNGFFPFMTLPFV